MGSTIGLVCNVNHKIPAYPTNRHCNNSLKGICSVLVYLVTQELTIIDYINKDILYCIYCRDKFTVRLTYIDRTLHHNIIFTII